MAKDSDTFTWCGIDCAVELKPEDNDIYNTTFCAGCVASAENFGIPVVDCVFVAIRDVDDPLPDCRGGATRAVALDERQVQVFKTALRLGVYTVEGGDS